MPERFILKSGQVFLLKYNRALLFAAVFLFLSTAVFSQPPDDRETEALINQFSAAKTEAELKNAVAGNLRKLTDEFFVKLRANGNSQRERGNFAEAIRTFQLIYDIAAEAKRKNWASIALDGIGTVHREQGEFVTARSVLEKSLQIAEETGDKHPIGIALNSLGNLYFMQGDTEAALDFYTRTLDIFTELKNDLNVSRTLNNIGNVRQLQGNYRLALESYRQSLEYKEKINEKLGIAWTLNNIGLVHYAQGEYALALNFYDRALPLMTQLDNKLGQAEILGNLGNVSRELGAFPKALEFHLRSLEIRGKISNRDGIAVSLNNIGNVYRASEDFRQALEFYRRSLSIRQEQKQKAWTAQLLVDIAFASRELGQTDEAAVNAEKAVQIARETDSGDALWQGLTLLGRFYQAKKDLPKAYNFLDEAISIVEKHREQVAGSELNRRSYFAGKTAPFEAMIELLVEEGKTAEAFSFAERAKARVLLDVLRGGKVNITKSLSQAESERERALAGQIYALNRQISAAESMAEKNEKLIDELKEKLSKARLDYEAFETNLYNKHSSLKSQRGLSAPVSLAGTEKLLTDAKTVLLEFVIGENKTYLFSIMKKTDKAAPELRVQTIKLSRRELSSRIFAYHDMLAGRRLNFRQEGKTLFEILLKEVDLRGKDKIIIVPDGELWQMPFQALIAPDDKFLVESAQIAYAQSLTTLSEMRNASIEKSVSDKILLAFGNPENTGANSSLPFAEKQIEDLRQIYGAEKSLTFTGEKADEAIFKSEAGKTQIIHLAAHGFLNDINPMYSYLAFNGDARAEDGFLEAWEIIRLDLRSRLVVLSACETARGKYSAGEGLIGMTWAFFVAGAPTSVVSQWKVEEASTAELMKNFHLRYKQKNQTAAAQALRDSALKMLAEKKFAHPFYWAGFVVIGDGR